MAAKTKAYVSADWEHDEAIAELLRELDEGEKLTVELGDAREWIRAKEAPLLCTIKKAIARRLNGTKTFILIVGRSTNTVTVGSCRACPYYSAGWQSCRTGGSVDMRSYVQYEYEKAARDHLKIVVIYNAAEVDKALCPACLRKVGTHIAAYKHGKDGVLRRNMDEIAAAING